MKYILLIINFLIFSISAETFIEKAQTEYENSNYKSAIILYQKAIDNKENSTIAYFNMANAAFQLDDIYKAIVYYRSSIKSAPDFLWLIRILQLLITL